MKRLPRYIGIGLIAWLLASSAGTVASPAVGSIHEPGQADQVSESISALGACLAAGGQGDVLLVMDTSGSLKQTDPDDQRVEAAAYLIRQFVAYVEESGAKVDLAIAGFSDTLDPSTDWTALAESPTDALIDDVERYRDLDNGFETDYWMATTGARTYLADKNPVGGTDCQAWLWFSDGQYDLDKRDTEAERDTYGVTKPYGPDVELTSSANEEELEAAGRKDLCRAGGVSDQLRVQGIITLAVGLRGGGTPDFSLMRGVATGSSVDGRDCGRQSDHTSGAFILADDVSDLLFAFDRLSDPDHPPVTQESLLCDGAECPEGTHQFVLDASITKAHIIAGANVSGYYVVLTAPDGTKDVIKSGESPRSTKRPGYQLDAEWLSGDALQIDLGRIRDQGWVGQWRLSFVDPESGGSGRARSSIHLYGDVVPTWVDSVEELRAGESTEFQLGLARAESGETISDPTKLASTVLVDAELQYANGDTQPIAVALRKQDLGIPVPVDLSKASPGRASLHLTVRLTTAETTVAGGAVVPGTQLEPQSVDVPVTILAPPNFPTLPQTISFGETDSAGTRQADLGVEGDGCVWLNGAATMLTLPEGVRKTSVASSANTAAECRSGSLPLELSVSDVGSGLVSGNITVMTSSGDADVAAVPVTVRYELEMKRPRNDAVFWPLLAGITLAGVLIPIALLYLVKWKHAGVPGSSLMVGSVHGTFDSSGAGFLAPNALTEQEMRGVTLPGNRRRIPLNGSSSVRTKTGVGLTEPGYAVVTGQPSVSSAKPATTRSGRGARLPLALQDSWVALLDPASPRTGSVEMVFLVSPTSGKLAELLVDARNRAPDLVAQLRTRINGNGTSASTGQPQPNDWGGSPATQAPQPAEDEWGNPGSQGQSRLRDESSKPSDGSRSNWDEW